MLCSDNEKDMIRQSVHEINKNLNWWCNRLEEVPFDLAVKKIIYQKSNNSKCGNAPIGFNQQEQNVINVFCMVIKCYHSSGTFLVYVFYVL